MGAGSFKDLFSGQSSDYAKFRPRYPHELFAYLSSLCVKRERAWDCGTGSGQAAVALTNFFDRVVATDPSEKQLANAERNPRIEYHPATAEHSGLPDRSVDLVTVAQALHWFKHDEFYAEVRRVLPPGAPLAVWCYERCFVDPGIDRIVHELYRNVLGSYWEKERLLVEQGYREVPFPFEELQTSRFEIKMNWSLEHLIGYLGTWSALQKYVAQRGENPLDAFAPRLARAWGAAPVRPVSWPLSLRVGRV